MFLLQRGVSNLRFAEDLLTPASLHRALHGLTVTCICHYLCPQFHFGNFFLQVTPEPVKERGELRCGVDVKHVPRTFQRDIVDLLDPPRRPAEQDDPVRKRDRLHQVVRDEDDRLAGAVPELEQLILEDDPRLGVQRPERLVHQDDVRLVDQGPDQGAPLPHPAREFMGIVVLEAAEAHLGDILRRPFVPLISRHPLKLQGHLDVVAQGAPGQEIVVLGHVSDIGVDRGDGFPFV